MKLATDVLARFTDLPADPRQLRLLLDDVGIEVKRLDTTHEPVFTVELLANRGDHHCYEGIARELTGRTGLPLRKVGVSTLEVGAGWPVQCDTDLVLVYTATLLALEEEPGSLDPETLRPLLAAGIHSINAPVDATNLCNHEIGQPTHVFDADKLDGAIVLRTSTAGERAWLLFTEAPVEVPEGTLVVADQSKILAIAGVIGCEDSKATAESVRLVLESATFDPIAVRKASRAFSTFTDASARFERGADPARPLVGAGRVVHLLESVGWRRHGPTTRVGSWADPGRRIAISAGSVNTFLQTSLSAGEIADRLDRYGFISSMNGDALQVRVPTWRLWDVEFPADLYEEVAKSLGYNATPTSLPPVDQGALPTPAQICRRAADDVLIGAGFYEVITDGFHGRNVLENLGVDEGHPLFPHVQTQNAVDRAYTFLKNNGLGQALLAVQHNLNMRVGDVKIHEWTRTFHPVAGPTSKTRSPCTERHLLWGMVAGAAVPNSWRKGLGEADGIFLKGVLAELGAELGLAITTGPAEDDDPLTSSLHPARRASIAVDGVRVGLLGEVHPAILQRMKLKRVRPWYFEITADALLETGIRPPFAEPSSTHPMERTLAFGLPTPVEADSLAAYLHACGPDWLAHVDVEDVFATRVDDKPIRAVTYRLRFDNTSQERSADEVNQALEALVAAVDQQFGAAGVVQR